MQEQEYLTCRECPHYLPKRNNSDVGTCCISQSITIEEKTKNNIQFYGNVVAHENCRFFLKPDQDMLDLSEKQIARFINKDHKVFQRKRIKPYEINLCLIRRSKFLRC